jgi:hypothetical protein
MLGVPGRPQGAHVWPRPPRKRKRRPLSEIQLYETTRKTKFIRYFRPCSVVYDRCKFLNWRESKCF